MHSTIQWLVAFMTISITVSSVDGQLMTIDPFVGEESENFDLCDTHSIPPSLGSKQERQRPS